MSPPNAFMSSSANRAICARIGVRIDGQDMGASVLAYNVKQGWAKLSSGYIVRGVIEPYWRHL